MKIQQIGVVNNNQAKFSDNKRQPVFKHDWAKHASWGANYIQEKGKTNFKLFSFPDAKAVFLEVADKTVAGISNIKERVVQVLGTVGATLSIGNVISKDDSSKMYRMENEGDGIFTANDIEAKPDDKYRYIVVTKDNQVNLVKDPYAKKQESIHSWSSIYDPYNYQWKNTKWLEGKDPRRIVRNPKDEHFHGLSKMVIEEINIPTITADGTFKSAKKAVDKIANDGIANTIEIMPVENTYSKQWGYDGVDKFAINEKLGTHAELKELIDYAHGKGLNVIMDMVPNHMGTDGDYLSQTGPYESGSGQFGAKFNYEGENSKYVRDFMVNAALWWANEFKVDGIRFDMTKETASDYLLKQIVEEVNEHNPDVFLIAEDGRNNKLSVTRYDSDNNNSHNDKIIAIDMFVNLIRHGNRSTPHAIGFDSEWDFPFMHAVKSAITHNNQTSISLIDSTMQDSAHRVKYILSHDEIGNVDGTRLIPKILAQYLNFFENIEGISDADRGQKAAKMSQELFTTVTVHKDITDEELGDIQRKYGMKYIYDKNTLVNSIKAALAKSRLAAGTIMTIPGPKMFFQGEEYADLSVFKFFRDFSPEFENYPPNKGQTEKLNAEKGYNTSNEYALCESVMNQEKPTGEFADMQDKMRTYNKDLIKLMQDNTALQDGKLKSVYKDYDNLIHIHSVEKGNNKLLIFKNFANTFHKNDYSSLGFPDDGTYVEIFNSDEVKYGGGGNNNRSRKINANEQSLNIAANSIVVLKKV